MNAAHLNTGAYYQKIAVKKIEVSTPGMVRSDLVTETQIIEVEFVDKWAKTIDRSLNYAF